MKFNTPAKNEIRRLPRASVLIVVLWMTIGLVSVALYFANSMSYELQASDNRTSGLASEQAIEGAARYVAAVLTKFATNGAVPDKTEFSCEAVPLGEARYWTIGRNPAGSSSEPYFGLVDEGSKLNMNRVTTNVLSYLPNMTFEFAEAITDWRNTNSTLALNYSQLGYEPKHANFESVDELRLVEGADVTTLVGDDRNRNGVLDANEKNGGSLNEQASGLFEYLTVYSREPNFHSDGSSLTNVATQADLQSMLENVFGSTRGGQMMQQLGYGGGGGGGGGNQPPAITSLLFFYVYATQTTGALTAADFAKIYNEATVTTNSYVRGRVNVNTASAEVLTALFMGLNVDQNTAQGAAEDLVNYREQHTDTLNSIGWIVDALGSTHPVITALARQDLVTTKSFQFSADIAAVGPYGRGYRRVKFIFDTSEGTPKIIYRQDLSRLGWALGEKARQTYVTMDTK